MRKRAQLRGNQPSSDTIRVETEPVVYKKIRINKKWITALLLVSIFFVVLIFNTYFNLTSGFAINPEGERLADKFYLSGPDPYYNMRIVEHTMRTGRYQFYTEEDPILNYPLGRTGLRAPLLNMLAIGFSSLLSPFMNEVDAIGYSMQFIPALFGALLVFPVYFIGESLFGRKAGIISALLIALIPIHIGSGHGSAYALFDHDSLNLLLFFLTFLFLTKGLKEKDKVKTMLYGVLGGLSLAGLSMVWVEAQYLYSIIAVYLAAQIIIDILRNKMEFRVAATPMLILLVGYIVALPIYTARPAGWYPELTLYLTLFALLFGLFYLSLIKLKIPSFVSFLTIISASGLLLCILYFLRDTISSIPALSPLSRLSDILYGTGIYGNKVSRTIAEASTYNMSRMVMSYGPALYWLAWAGLIIMIYYYLKDKTRRDYLFLIMLFFINLWLTSIAGRFLNDNVPVIAILAGWSIYLLVDKIKYKELWRGIRNAGGGLRGVKKAVKIYHVLGVLFVAFLVILPNGLLALDAAVPSALKEKENKTLNLRNIFFGEDFGGAFGSSMYTEEYWVDAYSWLSKQDTDIADPTLRPAVISWWDYGFYCSAVSEHPTVADNFQDGIPPAANFHTAKNETEAVAVWIVRLCEGALKDNNGFLPTSVTNIFSRYLGENETVNITRIIEDPEHYAPSYDTFIKPEYGNDKLKVTLANARYHDAVRILTKLSDEDITMLYRDLQEATGYSIRYYAVEGYDINIFNIFTFLSDKGTYGFVTPEDDYYITYYVDSTGKKYTVPQIENMSHAQLIQIQRRGGLTPISERKDAFYDSMVYKTYLGPISKENFDKYYNNGYQLMRMGYAPTAGLRHFALKYVSPMGYARGGADLCFGLPAVIIAKYYEGAYINGTILCNNTPMMYAHIVVFDELGAYHDSVFTDFDGKFSILVPGGNITLQFSYANEILLDEIKFNSTTNQLFYPISEEEATRKTTNYTRFIDFTINMSTVEGTIYEDVNMNGSYDPGIDTPLEGIEVSLTDEYFGRSVPSITTGKNGYYKFTDLYPSKYTIKATQNRFILHEESLKITPGSHTHNISKPQLSNIEGVIYFDSNMNDEYDTGEEMNNVLVELYYNPTGHLVKTMKTDTSGHYSFSSLIPGEYYINASCLNTTTGYNDYHTKENITLEENKTLSLNISIWYATIKINGTTKINTSPKGDISIIFKPDTNIQNNTAQRATARSNSTGVYTVSLTPGYYDVTASYSTDNGTFEYKGKLILKIGEGVKSFDIKLVKTTVTVTGSVTYMGTGKENITIFFYANPSVVNNTAVYAETTTRYDGTYSVELKPGSYNVTVDQALDGSVAYHFEGNLEILTTDTSKVFNIILSTRPL
ncbi:MAG: SdrD B-like domain-containing protein [Candidatus Thermoplasmatota archaeon]